MKKCHTFRDGRYGFLTASEVKDLELDIKIRFIKLTLYHEVSYADYTCSYRYCQEHHNMTQGYSV